MAADPFWSVAFADVVAASVPCGKLWNSSVFPSFETSPGKDCRVGIAVAGTKEDFDRSHIRQCIVNKQPRAPAGIAGRFLPLRSNLNQSLTTLA
jgi:hypothetical protein